MNRGGKRDGAGRKKKPFALVKKVMAEEILAGIDEKAKWESLVNATTVVSVKGDGEAGSVPVTVPDLRLQFDVMKYLTDRRDGKAPLAVSMDHSGELRAVVERIGVSGPNQN
jgi:hypothetical protein